MLNDENNTKTIQLNLEPKEQKNRSKIIMLEKPKKKRVITNTDKWEEAKNNSELQPLFTNDNTTSPYINMVHAQIKSKINGYASQDKKKGIYSKKDFVSINDVFDLFKTSELKCYYCKEVTELMYENVREPMQWTLERLDNSIGHNRNNVVIACLSCNLRRRCMASERYVKTKEMSKIIKIGGENE